jgi:hypothetical protein
MGLDARRGAGFPPELYDDILQGWKTKRERSRRAHFASRRRKLVRNGGQPACLPSVLLRVERWASDTNFVSRAGSAHSPRLK